MTKCRAKLARKNNGGKSMSNDEVLQRLKNLIDMNGGRMATALRKAAEAYKKQLPQTPIEYFVDTNSNRCTYWCPSCKYPWEATDYCPNCGQRTDVCP